VTGEEQRQEHAHQEFVLAGQTVNSAYYCDVLRRLRENVRRLRPELWREENWLLHHNTPSHTSFFTGEYLSRNNMTVVPHSPYAPDLAPCNFSLFPRLKGRCFHTTGVIEAESQAVLNTLTEHDFQDAFTKWQKCWDYFMRDCGQ
jgi:hypothetical protein